MAIYKIPVKIEWTGSPGSPGYNVWHARAGLATDPANDSGLTGAGGPVLALQDFYLDQLPNFGHGASITVGDGILDVSDPQAPRYVEFSPTTITSTTTTGLSPLLAIVYSWKTALARRSGMGRTFWGPLAVGMRDDNDGTPNSQAVVDMRVRAQALVDESRAMPGFALGVLGMAQPGNAASGRVLRDITGVSVSDRWSYLSSRRD